MILSAPHLLETALLMLVAFLLGAPLGLLLRRLLSRPRAAVAVAVASVEKPAEATGPLLVTAPDIAPLPAPPPPTAAQRLAAAASGTSGAGQLMGAVKMPEL